MKSPGQRKIKLSELQEFYEATFETATPAILRARVPDQKELARFRVLIVKFLN